MADNVDKVEPEYQRKLVGWSGPDGVVYTSEEDLFGRYATACRAKVDFIRDARTGLLLSFRALLTTSEG